MKKILKQLLAMVLIIGLFSCGSYVMADDYGIQPYFLNLLSVNFNFHVESPGSAYVAVNYIGDEDTFYKALLTVEIQKRTLLFGWETVDIGTPYNTWTVFSFLNEHTFSNSFTVDGTGTYRALFTFKVTGTDGSVDTVEETIEYTY